MEENFAVPRYESGYKSRNADAKIHVAALRKITGHEVSDAFASE
jgi:hypothetical protein